MRFSLLWRFSLSFWCFGFHTLYSVDGYQRLKEFCFPHVQSINFSYWVLEAVSQDIKQKLTTHFRLVLRLRKRNDINSPHMSSSGTSGSVVGWGTMLQAGRSRLQVPMRSLDSFFRPHYGPGVNSASNRNEYQEYSWGKGRPARRAGNFAVIFEPTVYKMWEPQHLTPLWASTACYRDTFKLPYIFMSSWCCWNNQVIDQIKNY
jgi:hypothetical protein